jgi:hypothetical protein
MGACVLCALSTPVSALGSGDASTAAARVVFSDFGCRGPVVRPPRIVLTCADAGLIAQRLRWSSWGGPVAKGEGTIRYNDCDPSCAGGQIHHVPGTLRMTTIRHCRNVGHSLYLRLTITSSAFADGRGIFTRRCPPPLHRSCSNTYGGDVIRTLNLRCRKAHRVVRTWARRFKRDGLVERHVHGFRCVDRSNSVEGLVVKCRRGVRSLIFYANVP